MKEKVSLTLDKIISQVSIGNVTAKAILYSDQKESVNQISRQDKIKIAHDVQNRGRATNHCVRDCVLYFITQLICQIYV